MRRMTASYRVLIVAAAFAAVASVWAVPAARADLQILAVKTLWAGQTMNAGTVTVATDGQNIIVTYETIDGWKLTETHLYASQDPPVSSAPGQFQFKHERLSATTDQYTVPYSAIGGDNVWIAFLAAHADVVSTLPGRAGQTAWAEGTKIKRNWGMYFDIAFRQAPE